MTSFIRHFLLVCILGFSTAAHAETIVGRVVTVADGDTLTVLDATNTQHKIRLAGIDAPEKGQPYGRISRQHLADTVFTKTVRVEWTKRDRYGRIVGKVIAEGRDLCLTQIESGLAWHYKNYEKEQSAADRSEYAEAEVRARQHKRGLWMDAHPIPPWDWRHSRRVQ